MALGKIRPVDPAPEEGSVAEQLAQRDAELTQLKAEQTQREAENREAEFQERLEQVEAQPQYQQPAPTAAVAQQAQEALNISDEDLIDPQRARQAIAKIADYVARQHRQADMKQIGGVMEAMGHQLADTKIDTGISKLSGRRFFNDLEGPLTRYFKENPNLVFTEGAMDRKYDELVGRHHEELLEREGSRKAQSESLTTSSREPSMRRRSAPVGKLDADKQDEKPKLDDRRQYLMESFNRKGGTQLDAEEWNNIESGKEFPKKVSVDIQMGNAKPNVSYEGD